jgi:hypothetical protein
MCAAVHESHVLVVQTTSLVQQKKTCVRRSVKEHASEKLLLQHDRANKQAMLSVWK